MNRFRLHHITEFRYDGPVSESFNEVRLRPIHDERQSCISFRLSTTPHSRVSAGRDYFGNWTHQFNVLSEHRHLLVEAESVVMIHDTPPPVAGGPSLEELDQSQEILLEDHYDFLAPTNYVRHLDIVARMKDEIEVGAGGTAAGFAQTASDLVHRRFRYEKGATHVHSSIEDSLAIGAGVCQDFAHLLLAILRLRGIPAKYVSGYLVPSKTAEPGASVEEVIGGQASHAWVEAYIPGLEWVSLDPTLGRPVEMRHVRIAYGRDYGDVAPVRGVYKGHSGQHLSVDVRVRPALDNEGHETLKESSAIPPDVRTEPALQQQQPQQQQQQQ